MRTTYLLLLSLFSTPVFCQTAADSAFITRQVDSLLQVSRTLTKQQDFDKALEVIAAAEKISIEKLGQASAVYGTCCYQRSKVLYFKHDYPAAERLLLESMTIFEKALGKEHAEYVKSLFTLAGLYLANGNYEKAEPLYLENLAIREKTWGKDSEYAQVLNNLGILYCNMGNYEKAEPLCLEAKAIREKVLGKEHPEYAQGLNTLGSVYMSMGKYEKAEPLYLEAIAIREKVLGKEHPEYAKSLNNLGSLYKDMGNYEKAEPLYLEALTIREKVLGKEDPNYATSLENLAILNATMGENEKAEPLYLEALAIREKVLGKHSEYAKSLHNLASFYDGMGNDEKAEQFYLEAMGIWEKELGKNHPKYGATLLNLATLYVSTGNYEKAEPLFLEAKVICEKALGKEHPNYPSTLLNLAILYANTGNYEKAEPLYLEAKAIWEKILGNEHPGYTSTLLNLAILYANTGNYEKAEPLYLEAKAIWEKVLGKEDLDCLIKLADLYEIQNRYLESYPLIVESINQQQELLSKTTVFLSELELTKYATTFLQHGVSLNGFLLARSSSNAGNLPALSFDHALFYKGFLRSAAIRLHFLPAASPESEDINNQLKGFRRHLAAEYSKPIAERKGVPELEEKANAAEKVLSRLIAGYADANRQVRWQQVQSALSNGEAAIEFVHFQVNFPHKTDSTMYAALVLVPGNDLPKFVPLFEEKALENLLKTFGERKSDYVNGIYSLAKIGQKKLFELIWQPLEKELAGMKTIYFSPSGLLHRINLSAIPVSETENLGDRFRFVELGSTRQLVVPESPYSPKTGNTDALLFGGIRYEMDDIVIGAANTDLKNNIAGNRGALRFENADSTFRGGTWAFLPWTEKEINLIAPILVAAGVKPTVRKGFAATEEAFKSLGSANAGRIRTPTEVSSADDKKPSPRILHIATHGYFFPDPKSVATGSSEPVFKISDHPMIRSGLILAGGNHAWKTGKPFKPGMEDGILTAYEISQMDLSNTELVVLSACETGLGDIQGNEGVYGLQRAFKIAGAKYLIMSLWQVPDFQTQELMTVFYTNWLPSAAEAMAGKTRKQPIPDAFRAAQQTMREKYEHPYFWAGFVLVE